MKHAELTAAIRSELGRLPDFTIWPNSTGVATFEDPVTGRSRKIKYGLCVGSADLIGILDGGRFVAIEAKVGDDRVSDEQKLFLALVRRRGGFATVVRATTEDEGRELARDALTRARSGDSE